MKIMGDDYLILEVENLDADILTGIYSEETHLPQPLRISIRAWLTMEDHYAPETPMAASKNYMDLKHAVTRALPAGQHFSLIEAIADHIIETVMLQDQKVLKVEVKIIKLAISEKQELIGITMCRSRK